MAEQEPDIVELLRELEQQREAEGMPVGARNRVQMAIRGHESTQRARWRRWVPAASFVAGAALVLAVLGGRMQDAESVPPPRPGPSTLAVASPASVGLFRVEGSPGNCVLGERDGETELAAHCRLVAPHLVMQVWETSSVRTRGRTVEVGAGKVLFEVEDVRDPEAAVEVQVSHGTIEVVGTRFVVEQQPGGGQVDLLEGKIVFHHESGETRELLAGERLAWGVDAAQPELDPVEFVDAAEPAEPVRKRARLRGTDRQAAAIIERVTELRARKRYGAAITEVRRALRRSWDSRTAQVLSYELGELLRAAEDTLGACEHFAAHQRKYPRGRYSAAVERVLGRLDCE